KRLRREGGLRGRCLSIIPASARNASLASPEFGKAAATSGSRTITALAPAYRGGDLLGSLRLKSYSGRIWLGSTRSVAARLPGDFFLVFSLRTGGRSGLSNSNSLGPFDEHGC